MVYPSSHTRNKRKLIGLHINHMKNKRMFWLNWNCTEKLLVLFFKCSILFKYGFHATFLTKLKHMLSFSITCCKGNSEIQLRFLQSFDQNIFTVSFTSIYFVHSSCKHCYNIWSSNWTGHIYVSGNPVAPLRNWKPVFAK